MERKPIGTKKKGEVFIVPTRLERQPNDLKYLQTQTFKQTGQVVITLIMRPALAKVS